MRSGHNFDGTHKEMTKMTRRTSPTPTDPRRADCRRGKCRRTGARLQPAAPGGRRRRDRGVLGGILGLAAVAALLPGATTAAAFHDGGVGACARCHVMHDAVAGQVAFDGTTPLLLAASSTDLCLTCHDEVLGTNPLAPPRQLGAGSFVFLFEDELADGRAQPPERRAGEAAGHSIVSPANGLGADSRWTRAPGGDFPTAALGCTSCHDPHGSGSYRLLRGTGPVQGGAGTFVHPAPVGAGLAVADPAAVESRQAHAAYVSGMTAWCANCHGYYHAEGGAGFTHPVDQVLDAAQRSRYEAYAGDIDPAGGDAATSYLPEVPFESPDAAVTATGGPGPGARLHCLTCHRAHASSAPAAGRWDFNVYRLSRDGITSGSWPIPSPYAGADQRQLCMKCHAGEHDQGQACLSCHRNDQPGPLPVDP